MNRIQILYKKKFAFIDKLIIVFLVLSTTYSCLDDVLDKAPLDSYSDEVVWKDSSLIKTYVNNTYRTLPHGLQLARRRLMCVSDESNARSHSYCRTANAGNITPSNLRPLDYWIGNDDYPGYYPCITKCNVFLDKIADSPIDEGLKNRLIGEVKVIRAYSYFRLISFFGGVPLVTKPFSLDDDFNIPRDTYEDCLAFVISELDEAVGLLPLEYDDDNKGRITKGAAMAVKARALLYDASPYRNPSDLLEKWQKAADATKAIIDLNKYSLFSDYRTLFLYENAYNSEVIWARPTNNDLDYEGLYLELRWLPNGYGGWGQMNPLHNLVEKYETINGKLPDDDPEFNPQNPFVNRDPRFYASILYDGAMFQGREVETFLPGGLDTNEGPVGSWNASESGYYVYKFIDESIVAPTESYSGNTPWIFVRYAEILLNYAETQYFLGNEDECRKYINMVRSRESVSMPDVTDSGDELLKRLQNERFIELAFEAHRYFDVRRWKIAPEVLNIDAKRMSIYKDPDTGVKTYTVIDFQERAFYEKNYLVPIPQSEIDKNPLLEQNPGYN